MPGDRSLLGDADRDRLVAVLREHYAAGRLEMPEFDRRALSPGRRPDHPGPRQPGGGVPR